jgi:hypothetical protein
MGEPMGMWITLPPRPGEVVVCVKTGATLIPGTELALVGGLLILTSQRLYHGPLNTRFFGRIIGMGLSGAPVGTDKAVDGIVDWANKARALELTEIERVEPIRRSSIRVTSGAKHTDFGIGAGMFAPVWSAKNVPHRDEMLAAIRKAIGSVR